MRLWRHTSTEFKVTLLIAAASEERCAVCRGEATTSMCRRCSNCGLPTNESTRLCRTCQDRSQCPSCERRLPDGCFDDGHLSRVHQSSTSVSDTAHGVRRGDGSRSSHDFQQRVVSRICRPKRRQHSRRRERLPEQTHVLVVYSAPTFNSADFNVNHTIHSTDVVISLVVRA